MGFIHIKIHGNTGGLKANQVRRLKNLYRRRTPPASIVSPEMAKTLCQLSFEIRRQIGVLIDRKGWVAFVIVGNHQQIVIPSLEKFRYGGERLKGLRCVHTHLKQDPLTQDDLMDLTFLNLDLMAAITMDSQGYPQEVYAAYLLPKETDGKNWEILPPLGSGQWDIDFIGLIRLCRSYGRKLPSVSSLPARGGKSS